MAHLKNIELAVNEIMNSEIHTVAQLEELKETKFKSYSNDKQVFNDQQRANLKHLDYKFGSLLSKNGALSQEDKTWIVNTINDKREKINKDREEWINWVKNFEKNM